MENFQKFIRFGEDRLNVEEIVSYGIAVDEDDDRYLYVEMKTVEDSYTYYDENVDFDLDEKLAELDSLLLIRRLGRVDFERK